MGKKILVADDSVTIQKVIKLALASEGYNILVVSDGKEAIRAIEQEHPDAVLVDVALPGADAFAVKKAIDANPTITGIAFVIMVSAFEKMDERAVVDADFAGRLIKPFDPAHLRKVIHLALNKAHPSITPVTPAESKNPAKDHEPVLSIAPLAMDPVPIAPPPPLPQLHEEVPIVEAATEVMLDLPPLQDMMPTLDEEEQEVQTQERSLENDIKGLTESTIKMSKLDEFEWNLDDSKKMKQPPPPPKGAEKPALSLVESSSGATEIKPVDDGGSSFLLHGLKAKISTPNISYAPPSAGAASSGSASGGLTRAEMEELIRNEFRGVFEKVVREEMPRIAEAVIRKEIERILSEP